MTYYCSQWTDNIREEDITVGGAYTTDLFNDRLCDDFQRTEYVDSEGNAHDSEISCQNHERGTVSWDEFDITQSLVSAGYEHCTLCDLVFNDDTDLGNHIADEHPDELFEEDTPEPPAQTVEPQVTINASGWHTNAPPELITPAVVERITAHFRANRSSDGIGEPRFLYVLTRIGTPSEPTRLFDIRHEQIPASILSGNWTEYTITKTPPVFSTHRRWEQT